MSKGKRVPLGLRYQVPVAWPVCCEEAGRCCSYWHVLPETVPSHNPTPRVDTRDPKSSSRTPLRVWFFGTRNQKPQVFGTWTLWDSKPHLETSCRTGLLPRCCHVLELQVGVVRDPKLLVDQILRQALLI